MRSAILAFFRPNKTADFLRSRNLFFVTALVLNLVWVLVSALDVNSNDTKSSKQHTAISSYNLAVQVISFLSIAAIAILDCCEDIKQYWFCHVIFDIAWFTLLTILQFCAAVAFTALTPKFVCESSSCKDLNRAIVVGAWMITIQYTIFLVWFSATTWAVSKRDPSVWGSRARSFDWEVASKPPLIVPSLPIDIVGGKPENMKQTSNTRVTWKPPRRPRAREDSAASHLPIQRVPPQTPRAPVPALPAEYVTPKQTVPEDVDESDSFTASSLDTRPRNLTSAWVPSAPKPAKIGSISRHKPSHSVDRTQIGMPRPLGTSNGFASEPVQGRGRWLASEASQTRAPRAQAFDPSRPPTPPPKSPSMSSSSSHRTPSDSRRHQGYHRYQHSLDSSQRGYF